MNGVQPVLDLADARPVGEPGGGRAPKINFRLMPGELALIDQRGYTREEWFADLCCGLVALAEGTACFLGRDWAAMPYHYAAALRGRIGRVFATGGWIGFMDVAVNILLPQLHHTRDEHRELRDKAIDLACKFGLPGLPIGRPGDLSPSDLARAACVRAFLGDPALVLLENPTQGQFLDLLLPLFNTLATARSQGSAAIWLTRSDRVWRDPSVPSTYRLRLGKDGLVPARHTA
ncbi:MAG TPA: ABC transporter ATP-binding protein [Alphaproteobacteria bacterium]|nr:ABC transporter ATP-binding protein [Alphaproteobacteria bacterium]